MIRGRISMNIWYMVELEALGWLGPEIGKIKGQL